MAARQALQIACCLVALQGCLGKVSELNVLDSKNDLNSIQMVGDDPEYLVTVQGLETPLCFHMEGGDGQVLRLIQDPGTGVVVNAKIAYDATLNKTYIATIMIAKESFRFLASPQDIKVNNMEVKWDKTTALDIKGDQVAVRNNVAAITFGRINVTLRVRRLFQELDGGYLRHARVSGSKAPGGYHSDTHDRSDLDESAPAGRVRRLVKRNLAPYEEPVRLHIHEGKIHSGAQHRYQHRHLVHHHNPGFPSGHYNPNERFRRDNSRVVAAGWNRGHNRTAYLGIYVTNSEGFSDRTHGLLGQFFTKKMEMEKFRFKNMRARAKLVIRGNADDPERRTQVRLALRSNNPLGSRRECWKVRHQGRDVIDGWFIDYLVDSGVSDARFSRKLPPRL